VVSFSQVEHVVGCTGRHVHGLLSKYIAQPGIQCYKDLAGNLKQVCLCCYLYVIFFYLALDFYEEIYFFTVCLAALTVNRCWQYVIICSPLLPRCVHL